jgi:hypothetical protein
MSIEQKIYDGDRAQEVLENEQFNLAFEAIQLEIIEQWKNAPARDAEGREKLWTMLKLADKFKLALQSTLDTGKLAKMELQHQQTLAQRAKEWLMPSLSD